jgi:hypothetical protein
LELKTIAFKIEVLVSLSVHPSSISFESFEAKNQEAHLFRKVLPETPKASKSKIFKNSIFSQNNLHHKNAT